MPGCVGVFDPNVLYDEENDRWIIGADAVGFSTVQEVIAAVHSGMRVLGLSTITNVHNPDDPAPATVEEIIEVAKGAVPLLKTIMKGITENIYETEIR